MSTGKFTFNTAITLTSHPGGSKILLVTGCYRNHGRENSQPDWPRGLYADLQLKGHKFTDLPN